MINLFVIYTSTVVMGLIIGSSNLSLGQIILLCLLFGINADACVLNGQQNMLDEIKKEIQVDDKTKQ